MARTTEANVRGILDTDLESTEIDRYIDTAHLFVESALNGRGVSDDILTQIETYVTAHLISFTRERQESEEGIQDAKVKYTGKYGLGLQGTTYGQSALFLDPTGELAKKGKMAASITAVKSFKSRSHWNNGLRRYY